MIPFAFEWQELVAVSVVFAFISFFINSKLERKKARSIQKEVQAFQKKLMDATKKNDEAELKKLEAEQKQMMGKMQEMLLLPFKPLIVILPIFFIVIALIESYFAGFLIQLPIALHLNEIFSLHILQSSIYGPRGFFILTAAVVALILEMIYLKIEGKFDKKVVLK
ncbi:MAG: EMC3/TMCO1 family protein [Candidatus Marsarchaeota archaeon]|nr:EMC3/TMCO1 family protein [Candidatus Marsarchaeota archaeon]